MKYDPSAPKQVVITLSLGVYSSSHSYSCNHSFEFSIPVKSILFIKLHFMDMYDPILVQTKHNLLLTILCWGCEGHFHRYL